MLGDYSSLFAVTQQQWRACVRIMLRCKVACTLPPSSLDPRLASGAFTVAKDECRDRFIGDRRPLNSRERSFGRAHLPFFPRLRPLILGKSETVQITVRDTKDCLQLYEVPPSRVAGQVIGPRISRSWLKYLDDDTLDVIDTAEIESWVSQDLLLSMHLRRTRLRFGLLSDWDDRNCHGRCHCSVRARMCSPPTTARCAR